MVKTPDARAAPHADTSPTRQSASVAPPGTPGASGERSQRPGNAPPGPNSPLSPKALLGQALLEILNGMTKEKVKSYLEGQGASRRSASKILRDARRRISVAAEFDHVEQLGKAVMRLEQIYAATMAAKDTKTALQTQREINRLTGLYSESVQGGSGDGADVAELRRQLNLIASYLLPLKVAHDSYPLEEHARVAGEIIRLNGLNGRTPDAAGSA